jgi:hypothetical protein
MEPKQPRKYILVGFLPAPNAKLHYQLGMKKQLINFKDGRPWDLPVLAHGDLDTCPGSLTAWGSPTARYNAAGDVAFRLFGGRRHPRSEHFTAQ